MVRVVKMVKLVRVMGVVEVGIMVEVVRKLNVPTRTR